MQKQKTTRNRKAGSRQRPDVRVVEQWPVTKLREHSLQRKIFFNPSADAMAKLRAELRNREFQPPIHALVDGTVVRGCLWLRAAVAEGRKQILVTVRDDLAQPGSAAA